MRTHRIRVAAAAAVTAAALSLTACQGSAGGTRDEGRASSTTTTAPTTTAPTTSAPTPTPAPTSTAPDSSGNTSTSPQGSPGSTPAPGGNGGNGGSKGKGEGGGGKDTADRPCDASAVRVVYSPVSRPLNHALLTVTNTGRTACSAYYAPVLRLDDGQAAVAVDQGSKPQAVVTLFPGESAYAAMILSAADGSGKHGRTSKSLTVWFAPRDGSGSAGGPAVLKLPAGTYTDSTTRVTYWQNSMEDALAF
ncbi:MULTISPECIES: DUF4232 domain-containing protein [unclassified Streptomyces]|uniref:DUF4232 domain-containing protein n=1 Tax=unclassified Streptomyces TaxID=2593676 RepID=UPI0006AD9413|nr:MULTISPECIES: DUF4232 domain-containing protein [unclassified Streptomyces]KOX36413.1 hypothetical protein ADL06_04620 [Streptomyces sp. NRRL F-6491]KOX51294.1 hypothetical protein ADL08_04315 [Streptomyces sp. NRRL F-6492]